MSGVSGDFDDFVAARWRELHAVATVTTGDPHAAARETASALAELGRHWEATTEGGTPTATARAAVLTAALAPAVTPAAGTQQGFGPVPDGSTRAAMGAVLAGAPPVARAALAARYWWDEPPALVATCGTTDLTTVRAELATLEHQLAHAHAAAFGRKGEEVEWALDAAIADALEHAADDAPVGDPVALVAAARTRGSRRRTRRVAVGAGLAVAVAAATALAWPGPATSAAPGPTRDDPAWASVTTWSPRGPLVEDATAAAIAAEARRTDPAARLLYAGPVGDTLAMVMTAGVEDDPSAEGIPGPALGEGFDTHVFLRLWTAPARLGAGSLTPTTIDGDATARTIDLVALSVGQDTEGAPPAVLVLTRPTVTEGSVVVGARPQPDGSVLPVDDDLPLVDGVATFAPKATAFPPLIALTGYQGLPAGTVYQGRPASTVPDAFRLPANGPATELAGVQRTLLSDVTGHPPDSLETMSVLEAALPASAVDPDYVGSYPDFVGTHPEPLGVAVVTTTTPDGGRVRTSRIAGSVADGRSTYLEHLAAVPATDAHALLALPIGDHAGFVAVAPDGATAQLVTLDGRLRDSATIHEGLATLASAEDPPGTLLRLRVLAPDGHVVYDAVPPVPVELLPAPTGRD